MKALFSFLLMTIALTAMFAQQTIDPFTKIHATGIVKITIVNDDAYTLTFPSNHSIEGVEYKVSGGILSIDGNKAKETVDIKITAPVINEIELETVAELYTESLFNTPQLKLSAEGASEYHMSLQNEILSIELEGASEAWLNGTVNTFIGQLEGASEVHAFDLKTKNANISTEGAASIDITVETSLEAFASGASEIKYHGEPTNVKVKTEGVAEIRKNGELFVEREMSEEVVMELDSSCNREFSNEEDNRKFDGHWFGVDLMMNNFISKDGYLNTAPGYHFMELEFAKSLGIAINFMEFNLPFVETRKVGFGLTTGLGLNIMNYRLSKNIRLINDSAVLMAYSDTVSNTLRNKLTTSYLMIPLILEFNTKGLKNNNIFHFGVGAFGGVRINSHSKVVVDNHGSKNKLKSDGNFHLNPFKYGLMVRMGWEHIKIFANYSLSEMFEKNEGPAIYPLEFGISLSIGI